MEEKTKRIIDINGSKFEVDMSTAKIIDHFKIGDPVKVLKKEYSDYKSYPGVIVGFEDFKSKPSIVVAYLKIDYSNAEIMFLCFNSDTKDTEICQATTPGEVVFERGRIEELFDRKIINVEQQLEDLRAKKRYFTDQFGKIFETGDSSVERFVE